MIITTSQERDLAGACGCPCTLPEAPAPRKECQSITAAVVSEGHTNPDDTVWKIYSTYSTVLSYSQSSSDAGYEHSVSAMESTGTEFDRLFAGQVGDGGEGCIVWTSTENPICSSTGSYSFKSYSETGGDPSERIALQSTQTIDRTDISGTESAEHQAWEDAHPDIEAEMAAWEIAHAAWAVEYAAWEVAHAEWTVIRDTHDAWEFADPETRGDEPPIEGDEPIAPVEPEMPPLEPEENYPPCTYKDTYVFTDLTIEPPETTTTSEIGQELTTVYTGYNGYPTEIFSEEYGGGKTYTEWVDATKATLIAEMTWPQDDCHEEGCFSTYTVSPEPEDDPETTGINEAVGGAINMEIVKARYRFGVPAGYSTESAPRSVYEMEWDEIFFPTGHDRMIDDPEITPPDPLPEGWEHPQIPDPEAPPPTLANARSWTWGGSMESPWSEWFEIPIPTEDGETRICNMLVTAWHSARIGNVPTSHGEIYELADPPPP